MNRQKRAARTLLMGKEQRRTMHVRRISQWIAVSIVLFTTAAAAQTTQTAKLVVAAGEGWSTTVAAVNQTASDAILPLTDCTGGLTVALRIAPHAHALARDVGRYMCALRGTFGVIDVPDMGRVEAHLRYAGRSGEMAFFVVPALRVALSKKNDSARVPMIVNDDVEQTWMVVFGDPGPLTFEIFNEEGTLVRTETAEASDFHAPWKMLIRPIEQRLPIGTLVITEGDKTRPARPVENQTYYGFVIVSARDGSSSHVRMWE
jgi:hypothetical protein